MAGMLSPGDSLCQGRYEVQRLLAQGGMGNVYLAEDTRFGNRVALKENLDATPEAQRQFQFEAKVLATLRHPCLPRVFDHFTEPSGKQYLVMDFVEGDDLQELLDKRGPLPENQVLEWMREVCSALRYMHEQQPHPVIHRDIKPANIKLKPDGQVMLVDFGIAKAHMPGKKTVAGARGVTPGYSPPEQYGIGTDARSDIYALGATMYHLLTGQVPEESIMISPTKPLVPPRQLNPTISPGVEQIILKAMALKANQRYLSTQDMAQALTAHLPALMPPPMQPGIACPICGANNRAGAQFCRACGSSLAGLPAPGFAGVPCPTCGANNPTGMQSCISCGSPVGGAISPPPSPKNACPACGATTDPSATFCLNCGFSFGPLPVAPAPPAPQLISPVVPAQPPAQEHKIAAWTLLGAGVFTLPATLWLAGQGLLGALRLAIGVLSGLLTLLSARDLLDLGSNYYYHVSPSLQIVFGDPNRGRRLGVIASLLITFVFIGQSWLILPLALVVVTAYVAKVLMSEAAVRAYGGRYARPSGVTLIGWALTFSGIGTLPGIALLIPKPWAKRGARFALIALATLGTLACLGIIAGGFVAPANSTPLSQEVSLSFVGGLRVRAYALSLLCYALATITGSLLAVRYLQDPGLKLAATQTSVQRELNIAGWILMGTGVFQLVGPFAVWPASRWGLLPRAVVILPAVLCLAAGRDLLQLFQSQYYNVRQELRPLFGSVGRGRMLGIVAAMGSSVVFLGLSWLLVPLALAFLMFYLITTLTDPTIVALCGSPSSRPAGVTIIAWSLLPTGIGTLPGIAMLTPKPWARRLAIGALSLLLGIGVLGVALALHQGLMVPPGSSYLSQVAALPFVQVEVRSRALAAGSYALALVVGCSFAIRYLQSPSIRSYFGA